MDKTAKMTAPPLLPRSLSSFISIAHSEMRAPRERRFASFLLTVAAITFLFGCCGAPHREIWILVGLTIPAVMLTSSFFHIHLTEASESEKTIDHLFRFLNYRRAQQGLEAVIGEDMLVTLEVEAQIWEQIESTLQGTHWKAQPELRESIQRAADHSMVELIALGTSAASKAEYDSWFQGWDMNSARLRGLLSSVKQAEHFMFSYQRPSDLPAAAPDPDLAELGSFEPWLKD